MTALDLSVKVLFERIIFLESALDRLKTKMDEDLRQHEKDIVNLQRRIISSEK